MQHLIWFLIIQKGKVMFNVLNKRKTTRTYEQNVLFFEDFIVVGFMSLLNVYTFFKFMLKLKCITIHDKLYFIDRFVLLCRIVFTVISLSYIFCYD